MGAKKEICPPRGRLGLGRSALTVAAMCAPRLCFSNGARTCRFGGRLGEAEALQVFLQAAHCTWPALPWVRQQFIEK